VVFTPQGDHVTLQSEKPGYRRRPGDCLLDRRKSRTPPPAKEAGKEEGGEEEEAPPQEPEAEHPDLRAFGFNIRFSPGPPGGPLTAETWRWKATFPNRPFRIRAVGDPSFFSVVMPWGCDMKTLLWVFWPLKRGVSWKDRLKAVGLFLLLVGALGLDLRRRLLIDGK